MVTQEESVRSRGRRSAFLPLGRLLLASLRKFDPRILWSNPVLLITWAGAVLTTIVAIVEPFVGGPPQSDGTWLPPGFSWAIAVCLWLTLLTATFAESLAEGLGHTQTSALRASQTRVEAHQVLHYDSLRDASARTAQIREVPAVDLRPGDVIVAEAGDVIPTDGEVVWGIGMVDESPITGESAPVIREAGGDRSSVTGGTKMMSDRIVVRVRQVSGSSAVDKMIDLAERAHRLKAPKELALTALLSSFSLSFVLVAVTLNAIVSPVAKPISIPILVSLVVCLIPTEIAALMSVTGIASMHKLLRHGVLVDSGHALETAGDLTAVLLDKTGTITQGRRRATDFAPLDDARRGDLIRAAAICSIDDPTTEGTSIIQLAGSLGVGVEGEETTGKNVRFSAQTRMSGRDMPNGLSIRKGAESAILAWLKHVGSQQTRETEDSLRQLTESVARSGDTPLVVAVKPAGGAGRVLGVIHLKDTVKPSLSSRIQDLRSLGVKTVMVTGDNPLTAKTIAAEIGVDDFLGDATPEDKLAVITKEQAAGHFVAMTGDGANDAPALAQADVGMAMNTATGAAKEAANMIILDDDPTKIVDIIEIGRRQMATRGALITFNIANDLVRYFTLFPALFSGTFPGLNRLNLLHLHSVPSAVLSTVIFSIVVMGILLPLALFGVPYRLADLGRALTRNMLFYGLGGVLVAAVGIKAIDLVVMLVPGY
ncbi:MAG: potassium-transporting ATPase subunit KdpB [Propionibacteriaceae bacterium]|nr:potassium-transporting ATPase subunit KdpB [Propionibacteriaceae bacterium]